MSKGALRFLADSSSCVSLVLLLFCLSVAVRGQTLLTNVRVGAYPVALAANPQTNKIYVVNQNSNNVTVIDGASNHTTTIATGTAPSALAINPVTNKIYVANAGSNSVTVIDGATNQTTRITVGSYPAAVDINPVTNTVYVSNYNSDSVSVIDGATNATRTIAVGHHPSPIAVNAATNKVYVGNRAEATVTVIDGVTHDTQTVSVAADPYAIAVNSVSNRIFVANGHAASVSVIDGNSNVSTSVPVGSTPSSLAADPVRNRVYVANSGATTATVIDGSTLATTTITVGQSPSAVAVDAVTNKAYFTTVENYGSLTMVNGSDYSTKTVLVGYTPQGIAVNPVSNRIYTANLGDGTVSVLSGANADPLQFVPLTPCRIVDTRLPPGPFGGPAIAFNTSRSFAVPESGCGVPAGASAYSLNVTAVPNGVLRYLTIWPTGESQPVVSSLNSMDGRTKANAAIVPAGAAGAISVYASDTTDVLIDVNGYFAAPNQQSLQFYPLPPCRVLDTRNQPGHLGGPYLHGSLERDFPVIESDCQVPPAAVAYSMNFTVVPWQNKPMGYLSTWAAGGRQPLVSTLNNPTATIVANAAIVPAGVGGAVAVYPSQDTDLIADINGYFAAPANGGLSLYPTAPCRVLDTRSSGGAFQGQREPAVNVAASPCGIPSAAFAYTLNATAMPLAPLGYLTLWPEGQLMPVASTLNARDGLVTSNMAVVPSQNGQIDAYASALTQLILDISSYFAP